MVEDTRRDLADRPIKEIAYLLGFSNLSNFTRAFRGWFGVAPRAYRARLRGPEEAEAPPSPAP